MCIWHCFSHYKAWIGGWKSLSCELGGGSQWDVVVETRRGRSSDILDCTMASAPPPPLPPLDFIDLYPSLIHVRSSQSSWTSASVIRQQGGHDRQLTRDALDAAWSSVCGYFVLDHWTTVLVAHPSTRPADVCRLGGWGTLYSSSW